MNERKYCVYEHVFPNGKKYIGISCQIDKRWKNGEGYKGQPKIRNAIKRYGWDNIQHNIIFDDLSQEQANRMEKYLIGELNTIENGYNVAIGGNNYRGYYLNTYITEMIREAKKLMKSYKINWSDRSKSIIELAYSDRFKKRESEFWNEAERAITIKYGRFSIGDEVEIARFWYHMTQYYLLYIDIQKGKDVSKWREIPFEDFIYDEISKESKQRKIKPKQLSLF